MQRKQYLFCPGPVHLAENVKKASIGEEICHRQSEFSHLLVEINQKLLQFLEIKNKDSFHSVVISGSSTAANESLLRAVTPKNHTLVITNGEFGERLFDTGRFLSEKVSRIHFDWGEKINLDRVENYLKNNNVNVLFVVHHETSTGMLNPIKDLGHLCKKHNILFCVDAVSSLGAEEINMEDWNISYCTGGTGKAIGGFPGLSLIVGRIEGFEKLAPFSLPIYLDLYNHYLYSRNLCQTPNTPEIPAFLALNQALENILSVGVREKRKMIADLAVQMRKGLKELKLNFLIEVPQMSSVLTSVVTPNLFTTLELINELRKKKIIVYPGKKELQEKIFQVATIGELDREDIAYFLESLRSILRQK